MKLTGPQIEALEAALMDAFGNRGGLERMARIHLERNLNEITEGENLVEITFSLIRWAERTGYVSELIEGAYRANPHNPSLLAFYTEWHQMQVITGSSNIPLDDAVVTAHGSVTWIRKRNHQSHDSHHPTIDREECINLFYQLLDQQSPHRFLHITGGPKMGKSHLLMKLFPAIAEAHNARCAALDLRGQTALNLLSIACGLLGYELHFPNFDRIYQQSFNRPRVQAANLEELLAVVNAQTPEQDEEQRLLPRLTRAFVSDLVTMADQPLVLIFDRMEEASSDITQWLAQILLGQLSALPHVCVVMGGRELPQPDIIYEDICHLHRLEAVKDENKYVEFCREVAATVPEHSIGVLAKAFNYSPGHFAEIITMQFTAEGR